MKRNTVVRAAWYGDSGIRSELSGGTVAGMVKQGFYGVPADRRDTLLAELVAINESLRPAPSQGEDA